MKDYIIFLLMIRLPQGTAITIFGIGSRPLIKDTVLTIENTQLILNAYPKEETEEKPFISFTLENIKYNLYID